MTQGNLLDDNAVIEAPAAPDVTGMVRAEDHSTSIEAAQAVAPGRSELQERVLAALKAQGDMTDEELEQLPEFVGFGPTTIRKRRCDLYVRGDVVEIGRKLNSRGRKVIVWGAAS